MMWSYIVGPRFLVCVMSTKKSRKIPKSSYLLTPSAIQVMWAIAPAFFREGVSQNVPKCLIPGKDRFWIPRQLAANHVKECPQMSANVRVCKKMCVEPHGLGLPKRRSC